MTSSVVPVDRKPEFPFEPKPGMWSGQGSIPYNSRQNSFFKFFCLFRIYLDPARAKAMRKLAVAFSQDKYYYILLTCHAMHTEDNREPADCPLDRHILKLQTQVKLKERGTGCVHISFVRSRSFGFLYHNYRLQQRCMQV